MEIKNSCFYWIGPKNICFASSIKQNVQHVTGLKQRTKIIVVLVRCAALNHTIPTIYE